MANTLTYEKELRSKDGEVTLRWVKNTSGGTLSPGQAVIWDTTNSTATLDCITTTTSQDDKLVAGTVLSTMAANEEGWMQRTGRTALLKVNGTTDIAKGDYLSTYTVAGIAAKATAGKGGAFAIAREAYTANDSNGVIDADLFLPARVDSTGAILATDVGTMAANGTSTANTLGDAATAAPINHIHKIGDHDHSDNTKGNAIVLAAMGADIFTADAAGRGKFQTGLLDAATLLDLVVADAFTNANCDAFFASSAFAADADSRALFADGIWTTAKLAAGVLSADATGRALFAAGVLDVTTFQSAVAAGVLSADATGRALMATGFFSAAKVLDAFAANAIDATAAAAIFADSAIPTSKVNWSFGPVGSIVDIVPDASAATGSAAGVARIDHTHGIATATPSGSHVPDCADTEGVANTFVRSDHIHALTCAAPSAGLAAADAEGAATSFARSNHVHKATVTDAVDFTFGASDDVALRWSTGDADNHAFVVALGLSHALHLTDVAAVATDWAVAADTHPTVYVHSDTTPTTDYLKVWHDATTAFIQSVGGTLDITAAGEVTVNDASADVDFRVEANGLAYAIFVNAGTDSICLGSNADNSEADKVVRIARSARTATAATNFADLWVANAGAVTTGGGATTHDVIATAYFAEPNITNAGGDTVSVAATIYIANAPTEGAANYGLASTVRIGIVADAQDFTLGASDDVQMRWSSADADNHAFVIGLGASLAMHVAQAADIATDWNVAAAVNPTLYVHGATTPATEYIALSTDETDAHLNAVGANWKFEIGGTAELTLAANALNLVDSTLYGSAAANGDLTLAATSHGTVATAYIVANQMIDATVNSLAVRVKAGAIGDAETAQTDLNGEVGIDSTNGRWYFRYGAAWHYTAITAGFEIPEYERNCPVCGTEILPGQAVVGVIDGILDDGARHGLWVHQDCPKNPRDVKLAHKVAPRGREYAQVV